MNHSKISLLFLFLFAFCRLSAQTGEGLIAPVFNDKYCETIKKLEAGETDINYREFRESFIESEQFRVANKQFRMFDSLKKQMYREMDKSDYTQVMRAARGMLSIDYTSMLAHKILQQTAKATGDSATYKKHHAIEFGLLRSIVKNGDGKTCATAWPVIQIEEEYFILDMIDAKLIEQSIDNDGGLCDKMKVKEEGKKKTYYFDVTKVFEGYKKFKTKE